MKLEFTDGEPRKRLGILLFAAEGQGKSVGAASAPAPIIYVNADRAGALRYARRHYAGKAILEYPVDSRKSFESLYMALRSGEYDEVETVVLDSLGKIYDVALNDVAKDPKKPTLPERGEVNTWMSGFLIELLKLDVHVVLVAHDNPVVTSGSEEEGTARIELFPFTGTANPGLAKKIMRELDIVAYCGRMPVPDGQELPDSPAVDQERRIKFVAQLAPGGGRRVKETTGVLADVELLDLSDWIARIDAVYGSSITTEKVAA